MSKPILSTSADEVSRIAAMLCNCARSRGRHSTYCPAYTALPRLGRALASHRARFLGADPRQDG